MDFSKYLGMLLDRGGKFVAAMIAFIGLIQLAIGVAPYYLKNHEKLDDALRGAQGCCIAWAFASVVWGQKENRKLQAQASAAILHLQRVAAADAAIRAPGPSKSSDATVQKMIEVIERTSSDGTRVDPA